MDERAIIGELRDIVVKRLRFDPARLVELNFETPLTKGVDGSLDFIELSIALEERFGIVIQEGEDVLEHFGTFGALVRFVEARVTT